MVLSPVHEFEFDHHFQDLHRATHGTNEDEK